MVCGLHTNLTAANSGVAAESDLCLISSDLFSLQTFEGFLTLLFFDALRLPLVARSYR